MPSWGVRLGVATSEEERMRGRLLALVALLGLLVGVTPAAAQAPTGDIVGRVVDASGAVLPGVVVTVSGGALIQPLTATTGETGTYQFPGLQPGSAYTVKFELTGFRTVIVERRPPFFQPMMIPSKTWMRSLSPSLIFVWTRTVSPMRSFGRSVRRYCFSISSMTVFMALFFGRWARGGGRARPASR